MSESAALGDLLGLAMKVFVLLLVVTFAGGLCHDGSLMVNYNLFVSLSLNYQTLGESVKCTLYSYRYIISSHFVKD